MRSTVLLQFIVLFISWSNSDTRLSAQSMEYRERRELVRSTTGITTVQATGKPFTGYKYALHYNKPDTQAVELIVNGRTEWEKRYSEEGKLIFIWTFYNHGLKQDSICDEYYQMDRYTGDTNTYVYTFIDRNKVKWRRQLVYYPRRQTGGKRTVHLQQDARCVTRRDVRKWSRKLYRKKKDYDSLGYSDNYRASGKDYTFHTNGKVACVGQRSSYEYYVTHKGTSAPYPSSGMTGVWTYYDTTGRVTAENIYDSIVGNHLESRGYYPDGSYKIRTWFNVLYSSLSLRAPQRVPLMPGDTVYRAEARWMEDGTLVAVDIDARNWVSVDYAFYPNGNPARFLCYQSQYGFRPIGIRQDWDDQGRTTSFINYSDNSNDTICYVAKGGQVLKVNLMSRDSLGKWRGFSNYISDMFYLHQRIWEMTEVYRTYNEWGTLTSETQMKLGRRHGTCREWYANGVLSVSGVYNNGKVNGSWQEFYPDGRTKLVQPFSNGIRNGIREEYYSNGQLKWKNTYVNGAPGKGQAYSEAGDIIPAADYMHAFVDPLCLKKQSDELRSTALHYYLLDSAIVQTDVTLSDTAFKTDLTLLTIMATLLDSSADYCTSHLSGVDDNAYDPKRSVFSISPELFDAKGRKNITAFFTRHGIRMDSVVQSSEAVLEDSLTYLVYYSSDKVLNKKLVADSLDAIVFAEPGSLQKGYVIHLDSYVPQAQLKFPAGFDTEWISGTGYVELRFTQLPDHWYYGQASTYSLFIYDDGTYDPVNMHTNADRTNTWAQYGTW